MLQVTLELKNNEDEMLLLPLLQRLGIRYSTLKKEDNNESLAYHRQIIERGVDMADFDGFLQEFNDSRQDRHLPFRNE
ncbi:hypothetical protein [Methylovulum psychrotolerans]|jgi:hypothetical protein|uniref:Uncharacterized protein n=1 Tax=Methylovulum psychrotolerans TaxID=1704499 RepID=A0A1Z4C0V4_9GAMM|nr:hypothetical protein [Methylovulum psychrotolerans]ASF47167.1 hypothetical protein CEK71_14435 [Methylovulum psychrotolerans]MBT9097195.1 hypothetical protein [Methylovulum psychrotolerans]POZ51662.1 hypothetical protein AADEFJLK_02531 [Methylovulum psychrotolerans]